MTTTPIILSQRVLHELRSLPENERVDVSTALICSLLGHDIADTLSGTSAIAYSMLSSNVRRDSERYMRSMAH